MPSTTNGTTARRRAPAAETTDSAAESFPPHDENPERRRAWFHHELKKHTNAETGRGWTQADIAREVAKEIDSCTQGHVSLTLGGTRTLGDVTKKIQRVVARILGRSQTELFGHVCSQCTTCGTRHTPRRIQPTEADT